MRNLTFTLNDELTILEKYSISPTEFMFIQALLLYQSNSEGNEETAYLARFWKLMKNIGCPMTKLIEGLQSKGIINKSYKIKKENESINPSEIPVNQIFYKGLFKATDAMYNELFDRYPQSCMINGNLVMIRNIAKHFNSDDAARFAYGKAIKWNPEIHNKVLELLDWAIDKDLINCSLSSFIINKAWLSLEGIKNGDLGNINYDSIKLI